MTTYSILTNAEIYQYLVDLISTKFITEEKATRFVETFYKQGKITEEQYKELKLLIEMTY